MTLESANFSALPADTLVEPPYDQPQVSAMATKDIVELAAADSIFYSRHFFPNAFRQESPVFHQQVWDLLDGPEYTYIGLEMFRGSAKTTLTRTNVSKRVAYGISRVILFTSAAQAHAIRSVQWLKKQVSGNRKWAQTYGLRKGNKWADDEIEIVNELLGISIYVLAVGISGQIRGVNLEDYRPDFIIADDPCDEENTGTEDQRDKTAALFYGALAPGLAPKSEAPSAKMALLQTGLAKGDLINIAHEDPEWHTVKFGVLDYDSGEPKSRWPARWSTEELLTKKANYTGRGQLHLWLREYECEITSPEEAPLKLHWLKYFDTEPEIMVIYMAIDPAREKSKNPHKTCISVIGVTPKKEVYLLDYFEQTSLNPEQTWDAFYGLAMRYRPYMVGIETIAYQQSLAWYFRQKMEQVGTFWVLQEVEDRRKKPDRILQAFSGLASAGKLYVKSTHNKWIDYFRDWRVGMDIDLLDSTAMAITLATGQLLYGEDETALAGYGEDSIPALDQTVYLAAP